jgi:chemotaxis protein methyltransferase CheR
MRLPAAVLEGARTLIESGFGLEFLETRETDLERGVLRGWQASGLSSPEDYLTVLQALPPEHPKWSSLIGHLTVRETFFFRDAGCFDALEVEVLPALIRRRGAEGTRWLRIWSAGCATGEEPYSLAMLLDRLLPDPAEWAITILATDVTPAALETARRGRYREWSFRETPDRIRAAYFRPVGDGTFELCQRIRRMVSFAPANLAAGGTSELAMGIAALDLILCRNVLMYFSPEAQRAAVRNLQRALAPGGWLVVSPAEVSSDLFRPLVAVRFADATFFRKAEDSTVGDQVPALGGALPPIDPASPVNDSGPPGAWASAGTPRATTAAPSIAAPDPPAGSAPLPLPGPHAPLERARALADQGDFSQARSVCEVVLAGNPLDLEAYLLLAAICQEEQETERGQEALRRAIYIAPDSAAAYFQLGSLLLRLGERDRGRRAMKTVARLLSPLPRDQVVPGSGGLTAGRLVEAAQRHLETGDRDTNRRQAGSGRKTGAML